MNTKGILVCKQLFDNSKKIVKIGKYNEKYYDRTYIGILNCIFLTFLKLY